MKRLNTGGRINRNQPLSVSFDGQKLPAFQGDTLASAMLAGGISVVGRSFKYHRPRGVYSAGVEEPGAMVHLRQGDRREPNARATVTEAFEGLVCTSQNSWPSRTFDMGAVNNRLSPFLGAGFYYKTFIGPFKHSTRFWMICEKFIRKAAGMGQAGYLNDPDHYEKRNGFCDILIIGAGVAGLSAALAAGRAGADVLLVEQDFALGGAVLSDPAGGPGDTWVETVCGELEQCDNVRIMTRTTVFGAYDGNTFGLIERVSDHIRAPEDHQVRQRYWLIHAQRAIMASGAIERPLIFAGNDKPGVMLAGSVRTYLNRFSVLTGEQVVVFTNNDSAYVVAVELANAGARVFLVDCRAKVSADVSAEATEAGVSLLFAHGVLEAKGSRQVTSVVVAPVNEKGQAVGAPMTLPADRVAISGGWTPTLHLWSQRYGKPQFTDFGACFVPAGQDDQTLQAAGLAKGAASLDEVIDQGFACGASAALAVDANADVGSKPSTYPTGRFWQPGMKPVFVTLGPNGETAGKAFVDLQHDVQLSDIDQAHREGYVSVEHLKRYTTLGMATDQGKLSNVNALSRIAALRRAPIPEVGTTTFRPPFVPISVGSIVGHEHGAHFRPTRRSPIHHWHIENGAAMTEAGAWMRPWYYPQRSEDLQAAYIREAAHVRKHVGMVDVSTLGKIAVQGPDAAEFLNRIYTNGWKTLAVGRLRYGVMLREDGIVLDDGATARLGEHDYFMSTTTANAARVLAFAEQLLQTAWCDLRVHVTSVTDQWAVIAVAGPKSRALLSRIADADLSREALPNNHFTQSKIDGISVRIHRMSYSGELAYEIYVPSNYGRHVWDRLIDAGDAFNLKPYGTEAMGALRIEKGHVAGPEIDGRTTMRDLGLESLASDKKPFVGSVLRTREVLQDSRRPILVGLEIEGETGVKAGSLLFADGKAAEGHAEGWVSSATYSPALGKNIALAFLQEGLSRIGEDILVENFVDNESHRARVVSHHFFDPQGERQNA